VNRRDVRALIFKLNRVVKAHRQSAEEMTLVDDGLIMALWKQGLDTFDIAKQLHLHEWQVANRLLHLREAARGQ
jgi:hypothetical protein